MEETMMKMMKKFSLLVAIALLITVGGVYATWNYAQGEVGNSASNLVPKLAGYATTTSKGSIAIDTTGLTIMIDDTNADHIAELSMTGKITVTFTHAPGADSSVVSNGIPMQYHLDILYNDGQSAETWKYAGQSIMTVNTAVQTVNSGNPISSFDIEAAELMNLIQLGGTFKLDELSDYTSFNAVLGRAQIQISVSEITD